MKHAKDSFELHIWKEKGKIPSWREREGIRPADFKNFLLFF
jgi:hypothetical protein